MDEHRAAQRRRLLKAGRILFGGGATIDCTVRNLSETGAALEVTSPVGIPDEFTLVIGADDIRVPCRVVWRKETRIGVHFRALTGTATDTAASRAARSRARQFV
jgi:hypothetical protein